METLREKVRTGPMERILVGLMILGKSLQGWNILPHVSGYFLTSSAFTENSVSLTRDRKELENSPSVDLSREIFNLGSPNVLHVTKACISFPFKGDLLHSGSFNSWKHSFICPESPLSPWRESCKGFHPLLAPLLWQQEMSSAKCKCAQTLNRQSVKAQNATAF